MEDSIIYIAGNPDAYPVEYFDQETGTYQGLIPEMMRRFAAEYGCDVRYYRPEGGDQRRRLAQDRQVDMISGCTGEEDFPHEAGQEFVVLQFERDGSPASYRLLLTETAPEVFRDALRQYLDGFSETTSLLLETAEREPPVDQRGLRVTLLGLGLAVLALAAAIVLLVDRYRARLRALEADRETDEVTGVGNHRYLARKCRQVLNDKNKILYSLFYFHADTEALDRLGGRKNTIGFLRHTALVLQDHMSNEDILARVADGGFALLRLSGDEAESRRWLEPVLDRINHPAGEEFPEGRISVGVYPLRHTDHNLQAMIFDASWCAQAAFCRGEECRFCTDQALRLLAEERQLQSDMERGLSQGEFQLYIQFCVDAASGQIVGGEALSRWEHPDKGLLSPESFLPLMEREGLVPRLDYLALENACNFLERQREPFFLSCNFSMETAASKDFPQRCRDILQPFGFDRRRLILEIPQAIPEERSQVIGQNFAQLRRLGVRVALSGRGLASFREFQRYAPDILKLDRELVRAAKSPEGESVLRALLQVCRELGVTVLAQGVETAREERFLKTWSCDILQGFRFYRPLPEHEAARRLPSAGREAAPV